MGRAIAGYPARWTYERLRVPYGLILYGGDLLSEQHKNPQSRVQRRTARGIFRGGGRRLNRGWRILGCALGRSPPYRIRPYGTRNRRLSSALDVRAFAGPIRPDPVRR